MQKSWPLKCKCCHTIVGIVAESDSEDREVSLMDSHLLHCKELQQESDHYEWFELIGYDFGNDDYNTYKLPSFGSTL